jgi:hypothetical protein
MKTSFLNFIYIYIFGLVYIFLKELKSENQNFLWIILWKLNLMSIIFFDTRPTLKMTSKN